MAGEKKVKSGATFFFTCKCGNTWLEAFAYCTTAEHVRGLYEESRKVGARKFICPHCGAVEGATISPQRPTICRFPSRAVEVICSKCRTLFEVNVSVVYNEDKTINKEHLESIMNKIKSNCPACKEHMNLSSELLLAALR